jgi:hypothetical protein
MGLFFVLVALGAFFAAAFIQAQTTDIAPVVTTIYSGSFAPSGIWSGADGNIYGCETAFHSIFKITSSGVKTDFAGPHGTSGSATEGDSALVALFNCPRAVWVDEFLYVTDSANIIAFAEFPGPLPLLRPLWEEEPLPFPSLVPLKVHRLHSLFRMQLPDHRTEMCILLISIMFIC